MNKLLALVGPTASGKTKIAIELARIFNGEIICADSRTVYKYLDIGTAKPTDLDQKQVKHWGLDLVDPDENYSVADFKLYAQSKIKDIQKRGKLPIIVGGSGLYIDSVLYDFELAPANLELRTELENKSIDELQKIIINSNYKMPENSKNKRYLIRTIEVGNDVPTKKTLPKNWYIIGINPGKVQLNKNINSRTQQMLKDGVESENAKVVTAYTKQAKGLNGGIYKILNNEQVELFSTKEIVEMNQKSDKNLIKKQLTWFKRNSDITWFSDSDSLINWVQKTIIG